jgi:hypothetical protein
VRRIIKYILNMNKFLLAIILLLIAIRIVLPYGILYGMNYYLANKIDAYQGHVEDFDLSLYRGAYQIQEMKLWKKGTSPYQPLIHVHEMDLSVAWRALFKGKFLADLHVDTLKVYLTDSEKAEKKQVGTEEKDWKKVVGDLFPIDFESVRVANSEVHFVNKDYRVPVDVMVDEITLSARNLKNTDDKKELLPSTATLTARMQKSANMVVNARFNALRDPMAFDVNAEMKKLDLLSMNNFMLVYGPFSFAHGTLSVFSEVAVKDGQVKGYVKPFFENVKMVANQEKFMSIRHVFNEFVIGAGNLILRNNNNESASKVEFAGAMKKPDIDIWGAVWTALKNGFGKPLPEKLDNEININSVGKKTKT